MYPSQPSRMIVLVAPPMDERAKAIAEALRPTGWDVIISADITPYLNLTRAFAVLLSSAAVQALPLFTRPQSLPVGLIPVLMEPMELPLANWVTAPIQYDTSALATTAQAIATIAMQLPAPVVQVPVAPSTPYTGFIPGTPASTPYYTGAPSSSTAFPPGAIVVFIGAVLGVIGFSLPWFTTNYCSIYATTCSINGWQILSSPTNSGPTTFFVVMLYILIALMAANAGAILPGLLQNKASGYYKAQTGLAGLGLGALIVGTFILLSSVHDTQSSLGIGIYLTGIGFIVSIIGGVQLQRTI